MVSGPAVPALHTPRGRRARSAPLPSCSTCACDETPCWTARACATRPHLPRLRLTVADFVVQQTVRRPSRNQPAEACKHRGEGSASKAGDSCGAAAEGSTGQEQELFAASQSRDSHEKGSPEQAECLSREPGAQIVRQPLDESAMNTAVRRPQTQGAPSSIPEHG